MPLKSNETSSKSFKENAIVKASFSIGDKNKGVEKMGKRVKKGETAVFSSTSP